MAETKSPYDELMEHARIFNRFASISGYKRGKIKSPEPEKPEKPEPKNAEVDWQGKSVKNKSI